MQLVIRKSEKFEQNFQLYREGASGANGGKSGGGLDAINSFEINFTRTLAD